MPLTCPPTTSTTAGAAPLYGTCVNLTPADFISISMGRGKAAGRPLRAPPGADGAGRPGAVIDDDRLAQQLGHARRDQARGDVGRAARGKRHDDAYRLCGGVLRPDPQPGR